MKLQRMHWLIAAFAVFWVMIIGWGIFKTARRLTPKTPRGSPIIQTKAKKEPPKKEVSSQETSAAEPMVTPETEQRYVLVRTFRAKTTNFQDILPVMGTVKGKTEIELKFEINGVIQKIYFREGEKIKKGDLIASLDPKDAQLRVSYAENKFNSSQAAYNSLQKKLEVHQKLYEAGTIIKSKLEEVALEVESGKFQVETTRSEMELAKNELNKTSLYASKDGIMGPREKEEGEFVTPQDKVGSLLETSEVMVEVGIVERDIDKIKLNQQARVYVDAYPSIAFEGVVDNIYPVVEGKSRTLTAKIKVPNPQGQLFPGMFSRAEILIIKLQNAFIIPVTALVNTGKGITLLSIVPAQSLQKAEDGTETGIVEYRRVDVGYMTSDYAQITSGLNADDLVILEAQGELKDKAPVKVVGIEEMTF